MAATITSDLSEAFERAFSAYRAGKLIAAEQICQQLLNIRNDLFGALHLLAVVQSGLGKKELALAAYDRALAMQPDNAEALANRGATLYDLTRFEDALVSYDRALAIRPDYAEALSNRGNALQALKRFDEALVCYERAIALRPDYADAHWNEGLARLLTGDFGCGLAKFEWRWQNGRIPIRDFSQPRWLGADRVEGKTVLLHSEQGFGDTIQFCRYVPLVAERGARVVLQVEAALKELMTSLAGATEVVSKGSALPDFDVHCPLLSLPLAFGTRLETIPSEVPYLRASSSGVTKWNVRLGQKRRPRIGLAWSGSPTHANDNNRSVPLGALLPHFDANATFISLQKNVRPEDAPILDRHREILHFGDALEDFSDTAALIANLDLVVSIDTSAAHLAGALGKPVWVLLPYVPDWRWLLDRDDSPWYPTARLFRQDDTRAWDNVIARVKDELRDFVQGHAASSIPA